MSPPTRPDANDSHHTPIDGGPRRDPDPRDIGAPRRALGRALALTAAAWGTALVANRALRAVDGPSMLPTLAPDDHVVTVPTPLLAPRRGDVVVLAPGTLGPTASVKRLVGLPGDDVVLLDGHLHVDGSWWDRPAVVPVDADHRWAPGPAEVVVLGDDPRASTDSRTVGCVPADAIERVAVARRSPWSWLRPPAGMRRRDGPRRRDAVRVVVLDPDDRTLLFRVADADGDRPDWWETPGGGLQPGEDVHTAALREVAEEVGVSDVTIVALDHEAERDSVLWGAPLHRVETSMAARVPDDTVTTDGWTASEQVDHVDWRWFTRDELDELDDVTHPADLAMLVDRAIAAL
ncbi:signal peptidase I [Salsipaludibacter albus]|uniref:signal peptidase I n=1 Tax=Salsipaludibacter albus TaxID=2849650 RepID=UPI001EE4C7CC|nr:signal peptidase I [Salsipaludibacter albus]MBY5164490.1 signal peptidase I [Salsipaludibacter albus]